MPTYINSIAYNPAGQLTGATLGNGVTETYGYDANRLQMTSQVVTRSGGPSGGLMNLTYNYNASAGQMGGGTTAGNAGQLMTISGTINGTSESAAYTYDNVGRLVTSNQTTNGASAARRFAYDRWGNRTGVWDAVTGGNQIQTVTLQQSGGAPTNRITSVNSANYTYDAAGNVTNDGAHTYQYDAENRVVNMDSGAAFYAYDQQNRRIKKHTASASTYYIWEGPQVIEEYDHLAGAQIVDYVYAGSRLLAKGPGSLLGGNGNTTYVLSDRLSARVLLDTYGNVTGRQGHLPYGEEVGTSGSQEKHRFTSYERDSESGTDYAMNRQYGQGVGRFMQADPYKASGGPDNPQSWNRYAYTTNEPINREDPMGLEPTDPLAPPFVPVQGGPPLPGSLDPCRPFGASYLLDGMDMMADFFCGGAIPSPADIIGDIVEFLVGGTLTVDRNCQDAIYISGYSKEKNPAKAWKNAVGVKWVSADFVATPKGVLKIPNGCHCNVSCSSASYSYMATCTFTFIGPSIMRGVDYGQQFPDPRDVPDYQWVGQRGPYQLISMRDLTPTGRIPTWEFVYN